MKEIKKISVCGLGKVGLPILSVLANSKYSVICYDSNKKLVNKLNIQKIKFTEYNLAQNTSKREEMFSKSNGAKTVPQIFIGEHHVGGNIELQALEKEGKLNSLLGT